MADYLPFLDQMADEYGVPREQARALYQLETSSGRNVRASSAGAQGHMQLMPGTAREMGVTNINDPRQNIRGGVKYFSQQLKRFGDPALAAAAYNAGPGRVRQAGGVPRIAETQKYVAGFRNMIGNQQAQPAEAPMEEDDTEDTGALGMVAAPGAAPSAGLAAYLQQGSELQSAFEAAQRRLAERRQQERAAREAAIQQRYATSNPTRADTLMALSRGLLAPRDYRGFGATMTNVMDALGGVEEKQKAAEQQRAEALAALQREYTTADAQDEQATLANKLALYKAQGPLAAKAMATPGMGVWSEALQRYVPRDRPTPVGTGVLNGQRIVKYSDGTIRMPNPNGTYTVYDASGAKVGNVDAQGNKISG